MQLVWIVVSVRSMECLAVHETQKGIFLGLRAAENWKSIYPGGDTCEQSSQSLQVLLIDTLEIVRMPDQLTCRECVATAICNCSHTAAEIEDGVVTEFLEVSRHSTMASANAFHTLWFLYCCESLVLWIRRSLPRVWHLKIFVTLLLKGGFILSKP